MELKIIIGKNKPGIERQISNVFFHVYSLDLTMGGVKVEGESGKKKGTIARGGYRIMGCEHRSRGMLG